ncbi:MAG: PHP domain-containing protein [Deltaproteobacteria bacterium]
MIIMQLADLHTHSTFSDGLASPSELVTFARKMGLIAVALTDHDTIDGLGEFSKAASAAGVEAIGGIEISAYFHDQPVHILGYGIDPSHPDLHRELSHMQQIRTERNEKIRKRFAALGIPIYEEELSSGSRGQIGRPHFARLLVAKGIVSSEEEAFARFLRKNGAAYVAKEKYPAAHAISCIRQTGGVAVLAHPWCTNSSLTTLPALISRLMDIGLDGIEAFYPSHPQAVQQRLVELAKKLRILITGGSDYHGGERALFQANRESHSYLLPTHLLAGLRQAMASRRQQTESANPAAIGP